MAMFAWAWVPGAADRCRGTAWRRRIAEMVAAQPRLESRGTKAKKVPALVKSRDSMNVPLRDFVQPEDVGGPRARNGDGIIGYHPDGHVGLGLVPRAEHSVLADAGNVGREFEGVAVDVRWPCESDVAVGQTGGGHAHLVGRHTVCRHGTRPVGGAAHVQAQAPERIAPIRSLRVELDDGSSHYIGAGPEGHHHVVGNAQSVNRLAYASRVLVG